MASNDLPSTPASRPTRRWWWAAALAIIAVVVVLAANFASPDPDGLERVAEDHGFIGQAENVISGILADYAIPGVDDPAVSTVLAGLLGLAIPVGVVLLLGRLVARRSA